MRQWTSTIIQAPTHLYRNATGAHQINLTGQATNDDLLDTFRTPQGVRCAADTELLRRKSE